MKLFVDYHHADLAESHHLVFADRFGWEVFVPYGMDWFTSDTWQFERAWHGDAVARQYLLGIWQGEEPDANGIVRLVDTRHPGRILTGITYEAAREQRWDAVMSSVPANALGFAQFARETGAVFGIHIGNQWGDEAWHTKPDFAIVTTTSPIPQGICHVVVHQEFSLKEFYPSLPEGFGPVRSFVNCFPETPEYANFLETARGGADLSWEVHGALGTAQADEFTKEDIHGVDRVAELMRGAGAIWHAKHWSDGFGHVIHNAFAVGRPVFGYERYYRDKLAGPLWVDGVTSFDVERRSRDEVYTLLRRLRDDRDFYLDVCASSAQRFSEIVSFDQDAEQIKAMLDDVLSGVPA